MIFSPTFLQGSYEIDLEPFQDERGSFSRFFDKTEFEKIGHHKEWVQLNHSLTYKTGSIRGMHFQKEPFREVKMVKCIAGKVYDVVIDLRKTSRTFLRWFGVELSAVNKKMIYIPEGFAHGFQCLTDNCEIIYHHTEFYKPEAEAGIRYNDPLFKIIWPLAVTFLSPRDTSHPYLEKNFKGI
jgi:dTDP-4-dehydrorhamnose 3,5-epimerase